jgi:hypothetical protein
MISHEFILSFFIVLICCSMFLFLIPYNKVFTHKKDNVNLMILEAFDCYEFFSFSLTTDVLCLKGVCENGFKQMEKSKECKKSYIFH